MLKYSHDSKCPLAVVAAIRAVRQTLSGAGPADQGVIRLARHQSITSTTCLEDSLRATTEMKPFGVP